MAVKNNNFFHYIDSKGDLYMYGSNKNHALGLDDENIYLKFSDRRWVCGNVKKISVGSNHTAILTNDNSLYLVGDNSKGQIGIEAQYTSTPLKIKLNVYDVLCNYESVVYINLDGTIGEYGNLSDLNYSDTTNNYITKRLTPYERYNFIAVGKGIRILGIYNIYDEEQRFYLDGNYEEYNQPHYRLTDFLSSFRVSQIKKIIISENQLFVLDIKGSLYYYGKYTEQIRCVNSGYKLMDNVEDIVISRDETMLYISRIVNNKKLYMSRSVIKESEC